MFQSILKDILTAPLGEGDGAAEELEAMGLPANYEYAVLLAAVKKARGGDVMAVKFLREALGEKTAETPDAALSERPVRALELRKLSDTELALLADRRD